MSLSLELRNILSKHVNATHACESAFCTYILKCRLMSSACWLFCQSFVFMRHLIYLDLLLSFSVQYVWSLQRAR